MIRKGNYVAYGTFMRDGVGVVLAKDKKRVAVKSMRTGEVLILSKDLCMKIPKTVADKLKAQDERA